MNIGGPGGGRGRPRRRWRAALLAALVGALAGGAVVPLAASAAPAEAAAEGCPVVTSASRLVVGSPGCLSVPSAHLGAPVPVSYFIPPACAPSSSAQCPVLYYLHGTGGSHREGVGTPERPSRWVHALTSGPRVDPRAVARPWEHADTATWVPKAPLDLILVSPDGQTQPGGFGPAAGLDTGWFDWNPRYGAGGDTPRYGTPPPRPASFLAEELVPFVDRTFPTVGRRQWRAILGYSQGGFGSYINGLTRPDLFASMGMESGGALPLPSIGDLVEGPPGITGIAPPGPLPFARLPGLITGYLVPEQALPLFVAGELTVGFGDAVADQAWMRASNPVDLVSNARARGADGTQSNHLQHFVNDAVPRRVEDLESIAGNPLIEGYEAILFPANLYLERVLDRYDVEHTFRVGPGHHGYPYQSPYFREQLEGQYAHLAHRDGSGTLLPDPAVFDYRTVRTSFEIWGWDVEVRDRPAVEFLNLTDVSCSSLTLRGTGRVTVTVPDACGTGRGGQQTFTVDLGPGWPTDELLGLGTSAAYGRTATVALVPR